MEEMNLLKLENKNLQEQLNMARGEMVTAQNNALHAEERYRDSISINKRKSKMIGSTTKNKHLAVTHFFSYFFFLFFVLTLKTTNKKLLMLF
jgi:regulator of replication initiation timing